MVFQCINIRLVPWEVLKTVAFDLGNVNAWKTMSDPYINTFIENAGSLSWQQAGFSIGYGTTDHIYSLKMLVDFYLFLAHLELCSRTADAVACCPSSVRRPSLTFHVFDISSWTVSRIEVKLSGRYCGNSELVKSFRSDIQDGRHGGHLEILQTTSPPKP